MAGWFICLWVNTARHYSYSKYYGCGCQMINEEDIIKSSKNKYEVFQLYLIWKESEMQDCKVKMIEENGIWYLLKDRS
jgi:hypothetical protein